MSDSSDRKWLALPLAGLVAFVLVASLCSVAYRQHQEIVSLRAAVGRRDGSHVGQADLGNGTTRSDSAETTQQMLESIVAEGGLDLGGVVSDASARNERVESGQVTKAKTPGSHSPALRSTGAEPLPLELRPAAGVSDPWGYATTRQRLDLAEPLGNGVAAPWGSVGFAAALREPWSLDVYQRTYTSTAVVTVSEDEHRTGYASIAVDVGGRRYALPVSESIYREVMPPARFRFSPTVFLGLGAGVSVRPSVHAEIEPELLVGFFSYGTTRVLPTWSFLGLGIGWQGIAGLPAAVLAPVAWNAGEPLPLFRNVYVGPSASVSTAGDVAVLIGLRAAL